MSPVAGTRFRPPTHDALQCGARNTQRVGVGGCNSAAPTPCCASRSPLWHPPPPHIYTHTLPTHPSSASVSCFFRPSRPSTAALAAAASSALPLSAAAAWRERRGVEHQGFAQTRVRACWQGLEARSQALTESPPRGTAIVTKRAVHNTTHTHCFCVLDCGPLVCHLLLQLLKLRRRHARCCLLLPVFTFLAQQRGHLCVCVCWVLAMEPAATVAARSQSLAFRALPNIHRCQTNATCNPSAAPYSVCPHRPGPTWNISPAPSQSLAVMMGV
jgi:hypothetical protein